LTLARGHARAFTDMDGEKRSTNSSRGRRRRSVFIMRADEYDVLRDQHTNSEKELTQRRVRKTFNRVGEVILNSPQVAD